jgi:hypothetical protein
MRSAFGIGLGVIERVPHEGNMFKLFVRSRLPLLFEYIAARPFQLTGRSKRKTAIREIIPKSGLKPAHA